MNAEVLEGALDDIGVRLDIADAGAPAVRAENGERRCFVFGVKVRYARALFTADIVEDGHHRAALFRGRRGIDISGRIYLVSRLRYAHNVGKLFRREFFFALFALAHTLPKRENILAEERAEHFNIAHDRDTDGDNRYEQYQRTPEAEEPGERFSEEGACLPAEFSAGEEACEGEHGGENNKNTRSDKRFESRSAKSRVETNGDKCKREKECANADNCIARGEHRDANGTRRVEGREHEQDARGQEDDGGSIADERIVLPNLFFARTSSSDAAIVSATHNICIVASLERAGRQEKAR